MRIYLLHLRFPHSLIQPQNCQWTTGLKLHSFLNVGQLFTLHFKPNLSSSVFLTVYLAAVSSSSPGTFSSFCWPATPPGSRLRKKPRRRLVVSSPRCLPCSPLADRCTHLCKSRMNLSETHTGSELFVLTRYYSDVDLVVFKIKVQKTWGYFLHYCNNYYYYHCF